MKRNIIRNVLSVLIAFTLLGVSQGSALAASSTAAPTTAAPNSQTSTLKISPLRTDISVKQTSSAVVKTFVTNLTSSPVTLQPIENDFIAGPNENGEPAIILNQNQYAPTHSLKRFMQPLPASITVPANSETEVDVTIVVPFGAQAGGYFGAVRFAPTGSSTDKSVNLTTSVASLILLTVPGPTVEKLILTNFDVQQNGSTGTNFRGPNGLSLLMRFSNTGNVQEAPFGQVTVQKGSKVVYSYNFNQSEPKGTVLPDSARRWSVPLSGFGKFGKYTVGATLSYGVNKVQTIDVTKTIWIIPSSLIFGIIGAIVLIVVIVLLIRWFLKSYKKRVLRSSRRH